MARTRKVYIKKETADVKEMLTIVFEATVEEFATPYGILKSLSNDKTISHMVDEQLLERTSTYIGDAYFITQKGLDYIS